MSAEGNDFGVLPDDDDFTPALLGNAALKWTVRGCALVAAWLCGWLAWQKLHGAITSVAGCGGAAGCKQVLGGRWSEWLGVPVSFLAFGFYLMVLLLTLAPVQRWLGFQADRLLCASAVMAILCAAWFIGLMAWAERSFCPYCAAAHGLGMIFAIPILSRAWKFRSKNNQGFYADAFSAASPGFLILVLGQLFGPRPAAHQMETVSLEGSANLPASGLLLRPHELAFFGGAILYPAKELPVAGDRNAPHLLVEYFDYTCLSCRDLHGDIKLLLSEPNSPFAVVLIPCPLNHACNPNLDPSVQDHPFACELAKDALAVWRQAPAQFLEFHQFLMTLPLPDGVPLAHDRAAELCGGPESYRTALAQPWIAERLAKTFEEYRLLSWRDLKMPKLLLRENRVLTGAPRDVAALRMALRDEFGK